MHQLSRQTSRRTRNSSLNAWQDTAYKPRKKIRWLPYNEESKTAYIPRKKTRKVKAVRISEVVKTSRYTKDEDGITIPIGSENETSISYNSNRNYNRYQSNKWI